MGIAWDIEQQPGSAWVVTETAYLLTFNAAGGQTWVVEATGGLRFAVEQSSATFVIQAGTPGPVGPAGPGTVSFSSSNADAVTLPAGSPVAAQTPGIVRARADGLTRPAVGLLTTASTVGSPATVQTSGALTLADWSAVLGSVSLTPRQLYFVDPASPGMLTTTVPTTLGQTVQIVGVGLTADTLELQIGQPMLL